VHAIGDRAIREALKGFEDASCRCRIEHASLAGRVLVERMARLGVRVAVQPRFLLSDTWAVDVLGRERVRHLYPIHSMVNSKVVLGFSSDAPVESLNPLEGVYASITRGSMAEFSLGEKIDVETALDLYTRGSALVLGERRAGCLDPGCWGDAVVLESDPLGESVEAIPGIRISSVFVGGSLRGL
jgi:predicted amidohydrolase YtcJ